MARTQAPVIDSPLSSPRRLIARPQPTVEQPSGSNQQLAVAKQATIEQSSGSKQQLAVAKQATVEQSSGTIQRLTVAKQATVVQQSSQSQPLRYVKTPISTIIGENTNQTTVTSVTITPVEQQSVQDTGIKTVQKPIVTAVAPTNNTVSPTPSQATLNQRVSTIINTPGGGNTGEVQFVDNGKFAADNDFKYNTTNDTLTLTGKLLTGNLNVIYRSVFGDLNNVSIQGGLPGQTIVTDGAGNLRWSNGPSSNTPGAESFISNGTSNASVALNGNITLAVGGNTMLSVTNRGTYANVQTSNNFVLGNATTTISTSKWLDVITTTVNPTVLFTTPNTVSSIDIHITADDGASRQITKMLSVTKGTTTTYSQYGNVLIGSEMAAFTMDQSSGLVRVIARPTTSNRVDYRLVITLYN